MLADFQIPVEKDRELDDVGLASRGDAEAFERLYRSHVGRVNALACWMVGPDDAEEAVQEVFVRAWQKLGTFAGKSAFGTWLHRVAVNLLLRRRQKRSRHRDRFVSEQVAVEPAVPRGDHELRLALETAVGRLPERAREVFVLHDVEGYKHDEIAGLLGIDPGTSRSQLHRARMLLRGHLTA
jgi:RNA polymerase sigma-70 factor (ECF subfamily)